MELQGADALEAAAPATPRRCAASRRLLAAERSEFVPTPPVVSFAPGCGANAPKPSRKREEAQALENLQRRVEASRLQKVRPAQPLVKHSTMLDNRAPLVHKFLTNRQLIIEGSKEPETDWQDSEFIMECLLWHNIYRTRHGVQPLALCPQLCNLAQSWANHLAHENTFYYRTERDIGQNLFCRPTNTMDSDVSGQEVASYWYSAVRQYNFLKEDEILHTNVNSGHFTQLIWASTQFVGLGKARSRAGKVLVVANYKPPGNISALFQQNVPPPQEPAPSSSGVGPSPVVIRPGGSESGSDGSCRS